MATMQTGELAHYSVQSDNAITVYKLSICSPENKAVS
jgi:hypothetical protein